MIMLTSAKIAEIVDGELYGSEEILIFSAPEIDSRKCVRGSLFLAFQGENVDGHDFAEGAIENGASLVIANRKIDFPCVVVADVAQALAQIATYVREVLSELVVIGITGSQGKTTTKDLLAHILSLVGSTIAPEGSLNNELGAPLTLLRCDDQTRFCIVEMGARHEGDIRNLCSVVKPNIAVALIVGSAHLGEFGSTEAIARAKSEIIRSLSPEGIAVLGLYDKYTPKFADGMKVRRITFGQQREADIRATDIDIREGRAHFDLVTPEGRAAVALRLVGEHQVPNALAAAAVCTALGISIEVIASGLSTAEVSSHWRMELHELKDLLLINDAYNANPESTSSALKTLAFFAQARGGQSWAFLGKMHELGEASTSEHSKVGKVAGALGIDHLVCVGAPEYALDGDSFPDTRHHIFATKAEAAELIGFLSPGDVVLVKGSRAEKMEELAERLIAEWDERVSRVSEEE